ncbi:MAG: ATP12 family chaperone protein [Beijerinckiaceae bacterium]
MRDGLFPEAGAAESPVRLAQKAMLRPLPKRFYSSVDVVIAPEGYALTLDGRPARTPGRKALALATEPAARLLAAEWAAQIDVIDPARMPLTRLANTGIDSVSGQMREVAADAAGYAGSDLVCYRADAPEGLVARQAATWDPILDWAEARLGVRFAVATGVMHVAQPPNATKAAFARLSAFANPVALSCLHVMTTISGSVLIALMTAEGALAGEEAFAVASLDEAWSAETWGEDDEAAARMAGRKVEFLAAFALFKAL